MQHMQVISRRHKETMGTVHNVAASQNQNLLFRYHVMSVKTVYMHVLYLA